MRAFSEKVSLNFLLSILLSPASTMMIGPDDVMKLIDFAMRPSSVPRSAAASFTVALDWLNSITLSP